MEGISAVFKKLILPTTIFLHEKLTRDFVFYAERNLRSKQSVSMVNGMLRDICTVY